LESKSFLVAFRKNHSKLNDEVKTARHTLKDDIFLFNIPLFFFIVTEL